MQADIIWFDFFSEYHTVIPLIGVVQDMLSSFLSSYLLDLRIVLLEAFDSKLHASYLVNYLPAAFLVDVQKQSSVSLCTLPR
jgi:hypothetical protein